MNTSKKLFSIIISFVMVFSMIPVIAFAEEDILPEPIDPITPAPSHCDKSDSCPLTGFEDTSVNEWYHDGIHFCLEHKIMNGTGDKTFTPNGSITRGMIVTMLYRFEGEPAFMNDNVFSDVESGSYYEKAVVWASGKGIVNGYSYDGVDSDKFGPNDSITREQFAAVMYRYAKYKELDMSAKVSVDFGSFKDIKDISAYALDPMKWACGAGLINGIDKCLKPADTATRAQAASIFQRFVNNVIYNEPIPKPENEGVFSVPLELNPSWKYADYSKINTGSGTMYYALEDRKNIVIGINAGHGTKGGASQQTYCHPDKTPKVTGGSTAEGSIFATAIAAGMTFPNGTTEAEVTYEIAKRLKFELIREGYDVLMVRDGEDVQLDNIARTVMCNNMADCHISIHFDSDGRSTDKGCFYISTPDGIKYLETVSKTWEKSEALGKCLIGGLSEAGFTIYGSGSMPIDLTQTCYSTVPSIDIELGNQNSELSIDNYNKYAKGLLKGIDAYFSK